MVTADTEVTKEEATAAVLSAFRGPVQRLPIKDIASHVEKRIPQSHVEDGENAHWRTSYQMMTTRKPLTSTGPLKGGAGMVIGGYTPRSTRGARAFTWRAAIDSGRLSRDTRMSKIRMMFDALDGNDDRVVPREEFVDFLIHDGTDPKDAAALFNELDEARTGRLTLAKFDHYVSCHTLSMVRDTFKNLDESHDRQIQRREFVHYFLGNGLSKKQAKDLWNHIDQNGNGKVNFVEYRDWAREVLASSSLDEISVQLGLSGS